MRVRDWQDILGDVVESDADPGGWRAVSGDRTGGLGEDMFLGHPSVGVFQLKTYAKNPFEIKGVGTRVARKLDDELDPLFPEEADGRFGVQRGFEDEEDVEDAATRLETVLETHSEAPTTGEALFEDVMEALDAPAFGPVEHDTYGRPESLDDLTDTFEEAEELLTAEFDDIVSADAVDRGFH